MLKYCLVCGADVNRPPSSFRGKIYCSLKCSHGRQGAHKRPFEWMYNRLRKTCEQTGWSIKLSYKEFVMFTSVLHCHYCVAPIPWKPHATKHKNGCAYYLDRKNSSQGYTTQNCVVCCSRCNRGKSNLFTYNEWVKIGKLIRSFG